MSARASKRAQRALYGRATNIANGVTQQPNGKGGFVAVTNGSVINNGGNAKFGLYPTVGVSYQFLNMLVDCCQPSYPRYGVNINTNPNQFLMN